MAVGFGFSVSDICLAFKIVKDSVEAIDGKKGSAKDYADLVTEITSLQDGLEAIDELLLDPNLPEKQRTALDRAVFTCQNTVLDFLESISKYQPHLHTSRKGLESSFRKVKWALCRQDDVARFRAQLGRHASSINMLLITFQARKNLVAPGSAVVAQGVGPMEDQITEMLKTMSLEQRQCFLFIMEQNKQLMLTLQDMRSMLQTHTAVPPQILLQQPVVLLDPFGKVAPFHLEFIDSPECFMAVLRARARNAGVSLDGLAKLDNHEFAIEDTRRKRPVDLTKTWDRVFRPGQEVDMRMVFHRFACPPSTCPGCKEVNKDDDEEIECQGCGLYYKNFQAISKHSSEWDQHFPDGENISIGGEDIPYILRHPRKPELKAFRPTREFTNELYQGYRRIQIVSQPLALLNARFPALQLIEDFVRFADLLDDVPTNISPYQEQINELRNRARHFIRRRDSESPAFSSFSQVEEMRKGLTVESFSLRQDLELLVRNLYNDPETKELVKYIKNSKNVSRRQSCITDFYHRAHDGRQSWVLHKRVEPRGTYVRVDQIEQFQDSETRVEGNCNGLAAYERQTEMNSAHLITGEYKVIDMKLLRGV